MKIIKAKYGYVDVMVSDEDFAMLSKYKWYIDKDGYPRTNIITPTESGIGRSKYQTITMHRLLMRPPRKESIDHKNNNRKDNRRENLRRCTMSQNSMNQAGRRGGDSYKGVRKESKYKWSARISANRKRYDLGLFDNPQDAARAYNEAAKKCHGEFAFLNVI